MTWSVCIITQYNLPSTLETSDTRHSRRRCLRVNSGSPGSCPPLYTKKTSQGRLTCGREIGWTWLGNRPISPERSEALSVIKRYLQISLLSVIFVVVVCFLLMFVFILFIYLAVLGLSSSMWDLGPWLGMEPDPLHWEQGVFATGLPGKSI